MLVNADEFLLNGSRRAGPSGRWTIQMRNNGEDVHDLGVRRTDGVVLATIPVVDPAGLGSVTVRLKPGSYTLFCSISDHESRGMAWRLVVRKPKVRTTAP